MDHSDNADAPPAEMDTARLAAMASSFGPTAEAYERYRPEYPQAAVAQAVPDGARAVLDLGAGTGKLTAALQGPGRRVVAVEPDPRMLARLAALLPEVEALPGTAEDIPLPDASVDAVTVGQAWHWFDVDRALPEIARVLRPGGSLALLWNADDRDDPLTDGVERVLERHVRPLGGSTGRGRTDPPPPFAADADVEEPMETRVPWTWRVSRAHLHAVQDTKSYMILAESSVREAVHADLDALLDSFGAADDVELRQLCLVWVARRR